MKFFLKLLLSLCLCLLFSAEVLANNPPPPTGKTRNGLGKPPPPPELPIDDYVFPMLLVSIGLGYYAVQYKIKKTPS